MRVLVIGASRGIGREFVVQYLAERAQVTATARKSEDVAELEALGASAFALDVTDAASVSGPRHTGLDTPIEADFDSVMHTNVLGPMRVIPQLADALAPGARLAVLSLRMGSMGLRTASSGWLYRASKAALNSVLKDVSLQFAGKATCVAFHPGWVLTDMGGAGAELTPERSVADMRRTLAGLTPAQTGSFLNHDGTTLAW
jgi:NAD(P)-dependent dehydrogenase (short-subunit alcohol dehydrogenase family)